MSEEREKKESSENVMRRNSWLEALARSLASQNFSSSSPTSDIKGENEAQTDWERKSPDHDIYEEKIR